MVVIHHSGVRRGNGIIFDDVAIFVFSCGKHSPWWPVAGAHTRAHSCARVAALLHRASFPVWLVPVTVT